MIAMRSALTLDDGTRVIKGFAFGPGWLAREERTGTKFTSCIYCGRDTSRQGNSLGVLVTGGGAEVMHPDDYDRTDRDGQGGDMGWFPVGAECVKQIPAEFRVANPYDEPATGTNAP